MKLKAMSLAVSTAAAVFAFAAPASAQISGDVIKIGFITDISGVYSDIDGQGGAEAIKFAIADMGGAINGKKSNCWLRITKTKPTCCQQGARMV